MGRVCSRMFENVTLEYTKIVQMLPPKRILQRNIRTFDVNEFLLDLHMTGVGFGRFSQLSTARPDYFCLLYSYCLISFFVVVSHKKCFLLSTSFDLTVSVLIIFSCFDQNLSINSSSKCASNVRIKTKLTSSP